MAVISQTITHAQAHVEKAEASAAQERAEVVRQAEQAARVQIDAVIEAAELEKAGQR